MQIERLNVVGNDRKWKAKEDAAFVHQAQTGGLWEMSMEMTMGSWLKGWNDIASSDETLNNFGSFCFDAAT